MKVASIPTGGTTIKMYYGKAGDAGASNGDATFMLFDDFESSTINAAKWAPESQCAIVTDGAEKVLKVVPNGGITAQNVNANAYAVMTKLKFQSFGSYGPRLSIDTRRNAGASSVYNFRVESYASGSGWDGTAMRRNPGYVLLAQARPAWSTGTWYRMDAKTCPTYSEWVTGNGGTTITSTDAQSFAGTMGIGTWDTGNEVRLSWIAIRSYTRNEPTHGTWST